MAQPTLADARSNIVDEHNKIIKRDNGAAGYGTQIVWTDYDGDTLDQHTGIVTSNGDHTLVIENQAGYHIIVSESGSAGSNVIFDLTDAGLEVDTVHVTGDATIDGNLTVNGNTDLGDSITDTTHILGPATLDATLNVKGSTSLGDAVGDTVTISGPATLQSTLNVQGNVDLGDNVADTVTIAGHAAIGAGLAVTGETSSTTVIRGGIGSAAAPTFSFIPATNYGMYIGSSVVAFSANGTNAMSIGVDATGFRDGSAGLPSITFLADASTGFRRLGAGATEAVGAFSGNSTIAAATSVTAGSVFLGPPGSVGAPTYSFTATPNYGMYIGSSVVAFSVAGTNAFNVGLNAATFRDGTAGSPSVAMISDTQVGMFKAAALAGGLAAGGVEVIRWASAAVTVTGNLVVTGTITGTLGGSPSFTNITASGWFRGGDGTKTAPTFSLTNDTDTGLYSVAANQLGISAGDTLIATVKTTGVDIVGTVAITGGLTTTTSVAATTSMSAGTTLTVGTTATLTAGPLAIGATPATAGDIRLVNGFQIEARNAGNTGNIIALEVNSSNRVRIGTSVASAIDRLEVLSSSHIRFYAGGEIFWLDSAPNAAFFDTSLAPGFGSGVGVILIKNRTTAPTSNPSAGGFLYSASGALVWRGSSGTVTTIAVA